MESRFNFDALFVLDLANNHQGNPAHALEIIRECGRVARARQARTALKFQFRHLPSLIHPAHATGTDNKHIPRFMGTALAKEDYATLTAAVRGAGLITMATPFDEASVDLIEELDIDVIKVASCSAHDWPLLEQIARHNRPVIVSTGGLTLDGIDDIVSFLDHRRVHFALMHCVAIYPTPPEALQLNQIDALRRRYPTVTIGFSTHEVPQALAPVGIAVAKGAQILERHVGIPTKDAPLNLYSSTPAEIDAWMQAAQQAWLMCGAETRPPAPEVEITSLESLQRGVYARVAIKEGQRVHRDDVYFAMPLAQGALPSGRWRDDLIATRPIDKDAPLSAGANVSLPPENPNQVLLDAIHAIKAMLNEAKIALPTDFKLEFSHHYGIPRFREVGAVLIDCINRDYCKKLIVQLPGQRHPNHYHKRKEEAFQVLSGVMEAELEGRRRTLYPGDILVVPQGVWHSFWTETGLIFEEVSTTHHLNDSFYEDKAINVMTRDQRKTVVSQWGRYQLAS